MEFKMERPGLVEPGQIVDVTEGVVAAYFYYTIEPAVARAPIIVHGRDLSQDRER